MGFQDRKYDINHFIILWPINLPINVSIFLTFRLILNLSYVYGLPLVLDSQPAWAQGPYK